MKSGDYSISRDDEYYRKAFAQIRDRHFEQRTFSSRPALVAKEPLNGHRMWKDYHGEQYDKSEFDLVEGMWDHEHCSVCWFTIKDGYTYWENDRRIKLLCDACHEAFTRV
ncbi:MAG: hypothetical protein ABSH38_18715 [Verrucomicrobiota bacterium]|jgi:hypothetical protein